MILIKRKERSNRSSKPVQIELEPNWCGQGGVASLTFRADGVYYTLRPETLDDAKVLMSHAAIIRLNYLDKRQVPNDGDNKSENGNDE